MWASTAAGSRTTARAWPVRWRSEAGSLQTPWLGLFGDDDQMIPVDGVEELRTQMRDSPVNTDVVRYPDAGHGFHCDARESYHEASAKDGWNRALDWFSSHLAA